jgi:tRNA(Arg) A34 adenosine deaminase TadA
MSSKTFKICSFSYTLLASFFSASIYLTFASRGVGSSLTDHEFMALAVEEAREAARAGEVPVGAVLVREGEVIAQDHNRPISLHDPTAHAEILVLRAGAERMGNYRLSGCELYVTIEPCVMCAGAIVQSRISRLIFGARDEKGGAVKSLYRIPEDPRINHRMQVIEGVLVEQCQEIIQAFFSVRRGKKGEVPKRL